MQWTFLQVSTLFLYDQKLYFIISLHFLPKKNCIPIIVKWYYIYLEFFEGLRSIL